MRYREGYFREEIEEYADNIEASRKSFMDDARAGLTKGQILNERAANRRFDSKAEHMVVTFKNKQEAFNREAYKKIEEVVGQMPTSFKYNFDNYATGFALLMEEFLKAKNTTELLTVCKLYNQGLMDETFNKIKEERENEKSNITIDSSDKPDAIESNNIVQEEQSGADPNRQGGLNSPM